MSTYRSISHSALSLALVAAIAGAMIGGLQAYPAGAGAKAPAPTRAAELERAAVLPAVIVSAARLPA